MTRDELLRDIAEAANKIAAKFAKYGLDRGLTRISV